MPIDQVKTFAARLEAARTGCRVLFLRPTADGTRFEPLLPSLGVFAGKFVRLLKPFADDGAPDAVDELNMLARESGGASLSEQLYAALFAALSAAGVIPGRIGEHLSEDEAYLLRQALAVALFPAALEGELTRRHPPHLTPAAARYLAADGGLDEADPEAPRKLAARIAAFDCFGGGRAFRFVDGKFIAADLEKVRPVGKFYGFPSVRRIFREQFAAFAAGQGRVPLLISSLPGHGKTQLTIAHALQHENLTLILAAAEVLESSFEKLIAELRTRPDRRFVVFFDDVDPRRLDWYSFRTNVGGSFSLPDHIMLALSSNYHFPPEILSRGLSVLFPTFDDIRCQEMIGDFLAEYGFRRGNANLVSLIAAGFTEEFGQKRFSELSPRTLMRHLAVYEQSQQKRRDAVEISCGQMITRPDPQLFYEFNISLMRSLYGDAYIDNLLKEKLRSLE